MNRYLAALGVWSVLIATSWIGPLWAGPDAPSRIDSIQVGLAGHMQVGSWTPVTARFTSGSATSARLVIIAPDADGQLVETSGPVQKLLPGTPVMLKGRFLPGRLSGEITVRVVTEAGGILEKRVRPVVATPEQAAVQSPFRQDAAFWGFCGLPTTVLDRVLQQQKAESSVTITQRDDFVPIRITLTPADLPDDAVDLAALDVLILAANASDSASATNAPLITQISAKQQQALREWVEFRGGHLVLSVGTHLERFRASVLGEWLKLPLEAEITIRQLDGLESYSPHPVPLQFSGSVPVLRFGTTQGNILARSLDGPLLVQLPYGFGKVSYLAVDLEHSSVANWEGLGHLLRRLLSTDRDQVRESRMQGAQLAKSSINDLSSQLFAALEEFPNVIRLSLWSVMALLGVYILIVGPVDYAIVHRCLRRPQLTWLTLMIWVVVGTALIVGLANQLNGTRLRSTQLDVVDLDETSRLLRGRSWVTLYSPRTVRSAVELSGAVQDFSSDGKIDPTTPLVSWVAPAENRVGGLYREGGVLLTQRTYHARDPGAENTSGPGYSDVPLQVWSTERFGGEWVAQTPKLVESKLVSSELGRLTGTIEHHLSDTLADCLLAYSNRVYFPVVRRAQGAGRSDLAPHFVWEIGGGQPVEQRELRGFLTQVNLKQVQRSGSSSLKTTEMLDVQTPYDPARRDLGYILRMLTFHQAAGGRDYTGMRHDVLANFDMSSHLRLGRAILMGRLKTKKNTAEWKVAGGALNDADSTHTYVRIVLPVDRAREEEARALPKPDEDGAP